MTRVLSSLVTTLNSSHFWSNGIQIILSALVRRIASLCQKRLLKYHKLWSSKPNSVFNSLCLKFIYSIKFILNLLSPDHAQNFLLQVHFPQNFCHFLYHHFIFFHLETANCKTDPFPLSQEKVIPFLMPSKLKSHPTFLK